MKPSNSAFGFLDSGRNGGFTQATLDRLINTALAFGTPVPSSVNFELVDNGYKAVEDTLLLKRAAQLLADGRF